MKHLFSLTLAAAILALSAPADASAQGAVFIAAGGTLPTADFKDFGAGDGANVGWMASAGVQVPVGSAGLSVGARGFYGSNNHDADGDKTNLYGGSGLATFQFGEADAVSPFVYGEFGYQAHAFKSDSAPSFDDTEWNPFVGGGAGIGFPAGGVRVFAVAGYSQGFGSEGGQTTYLSGSAGVNIPFGGNGM